MSEESKTPQKQKDNKEEKKGLLNKEFRLSSGVNSLDIALIIRHLAIMLKSSMPLAEALTVASNQTENKRLRKVFKDLHKEVMKGNTLASAMSKYEDVFSHIVISIIDVGEKGGQLEKNFLFLADFLKKDYELKRKVKGALMYPMIVFGLTVLEMFAVIFFILPKLESLFNSFDDPPKLTLFVINFSTYVRENIIMVGLGTVVVILLIKLFFSSKPGQVFKDWMAIHLPIIKNLRRKHILANFTRTLGLLMESGLPITEALKISIDTLDNHFYQKVIQEVYEDVHEGKNLSDAFSKHGKYFPATVVKMIGVGETTGTLDGNLIYLHDFYSEEVTEISNNLATIIEPVLLVFIGLMIGLLAVSIIGPIYQLTGSVNAL